MWVDDSPNWKGLLKAVAEAPFARIRTFDGNDSDNSVGLDGFKRVVVAKNERPMPVKHSFGMYLQNSFRALSFLLEDEDCKTTRAPPTPSIRMGQN